MFQRTPPLPGLLWAVASKGLRWVHPDVTITTLPDPPPSHIMSTLQTAKGDIPVTLSPSCNISASLIGLDNVWIGCRVFQMGYTTPYGIQ